MILIKRGSLNNFPLAPFVTFASRGVHVGITTTHNHNCSHNKNHNTMASKRSTNTNMTNEVRIALCEHKKKHPSFTQADLITWLQETHNVSISQGTICDNKTSPPILCRKMKWRLTTVKNPFLWRQRKHCSVQVCCSSFGCSKTSSTMRCLLASRQSRTRSTLWGLASSFRSQSRSIFPRFSWPNVEKFVSNLCLP